ncbi:DUF4232 domain-containing protein [Nocardia sp. NPDC052566]|uniref:DUF4232 domain-containing protein n=1 Tax=Nocardia sp. NPDC052566 TaxID=3364330 RepID=UPI0037CA7719
MGARLMAAICSAAVLGGAVAGCSTTGQPAATTAPGATSAANAGGQTSAGQPTKQAPDTADTDTTAAPTKAAQSTRCHSSELEASTVTGAQNNSGRIGTYVVLTNKSQRTCTIYGYPGIAFLNGDKTFATAKRYGDSIAEQKLSPGGKAAAYLTFQSGKGADCGTVTRIQVIPPDETEPLRTKLIDLYSGPSEQFSVCSGQTISIAPFGGVDQLPHK